MTSETPDDFNLYDLEQKIRDVTMMAGILVGLFANVHEMLRRINSGVTGIAEYNHLDFAIHDLMDRADDLSWTFRKVAEAEERQEKPAA